MSPNVADSYLDFLRAKVDFNSRTGFEVAPDEIHPALFPHQRDIVRCQGKTRMCDWYNTENGWSYLPKLTLRT